MGEEHHADFVVCSGKSSELGRLGLAVSVGLGTIVYYGWLGTVSIAGFLYANQLWRFDTPLIRRPGTALLESFGIVGILLWRKDAAIVWGAATVGVLLLVGLPVSIYVYWRAVGTTPADWQRKLAGSTSKWLIALLLMMLSYGWYAAILETFNFWHISPLNGLVSYYDLSWKNNAYFGVLCHYSPMLIVLVAWRWWLGRTSMLIQVDFARRWICRVSLVSAILLIYAWIVHLLLGHGFGIVVRGITFYESYGTDLATLMACTVLLWCGTMTLILSRIPTVDSRFCPTCGYDQIGNAPITTCCPECGAELKVTS